MINIIDDALDSCQRALLVLSAYECQKESGTLHANDEALSIRMIGEYLGAAVNKLESTENNSIKSEITKQVFTPKNSFTARLKMALVHTKTTQAALAWAINVSQGTISQIVTGKVKEAGIVRTTAIAEALGISANWLLYGEGDMHDKQSESFESQADRLAFSNAK